MDKVLYISGDGVNTEKIYWRLFYTYFDGLNMNNQNRFHMCKNFFISKAINSIVKKCDILNFCFGTEQLRLHLKLESLKIPGSTFLRVRTVLIINYFIKKIILWKIKINFYDLIVFSDNLFFLDNILLKNINKITSAKIILLSNVSPKYLLSQKEKDCIPFYDFIFISDIGHQIEWKELGAKNVIRLPISAGAPNAFKKIIYESRPRKVYDVTFIGRLDRLHNHRLQILNFLISKGVDLNIWTWDGGKEFVKEFPLVKSRIIGSVYGKDMVKVLAQSKIVINIHILTQPYGGNLRLFEIPAAKSLQIADKCPNEWFIDGQEILIFKNNDDLLNKIDYYLNNEQERNEISNNGYKRLVRDHKYEYRVKNLLKFVHD